MYSWQTWVAFPWQPGRIFVDVPSCDLIGQRSFWQRVVSTNHSPCLAIDGIGSRLLSEPCLECISKWWLRCPTGNFLVLGCLSCAGRWNKWLKQTKKKNQQKNDTKKVKKNMSIKITKKYILPSAASREPMRFLALCPLREGRIYDEWNKIQKRILLYFFKST